MGKPQQSLDPLGTRMKKYESVTRTSLVPRSYTILRIDGRAFHTYCKNLQRPIDPGFVEDFDTMAKYLCQNIPGAKLGYSQSDELTILLTDFDTLTTQPFFDGNIQKIVSVVSSMATASFNQARYLRRLGAPDCFGANDDDVDSYSYDPGHIQEVFETGFATFDCRVFNVPTRTEAMNAFIWRNQDCMRNAISMYAQSLFSHKELDGKNSLLKIQMIEEKTGKPWTEQCEKMRFGRLIQKVVDTDMRNMVSKSVPGSPLDKYDPLSPVFISSFYVPGTKWVSAPAWKFSENQDRLLEFIPDNL